MKYLKGIIGIFVIVLVTATAYCANKDVIMTIDYGGLQQERELKIEWKEDITALETLKSVAKIKTQPTNEDIIVTSIDGVDGKIGDKVWYYDINGKRATTFANRSILSEGDHIKWSYTMDVCSPKTDKGNSE